MANLSQAETTPQDLIRDTARLVFDLSGAIPPDLLNSLQHLLAALPEAAAIVDDNRRVVLFNAPLAKLLGAGPDAEVLGRRLGEVLGCMFSLQGPGGCGTSRHCAQCPTRRMIARELPEGDADFDLCDSDLLHDPAKFKVCLTHLTFGEGHLHLVSLLPRDDQRGSRELERAFLHQVYSTASALVSTSQMLVESHGADDCSPEDEAELKKILYDGSLQLLEEIRDRRSDLDLQNGDIPLAWEEISIPDLMRGLATAGPENLECDMSQDQTAPDDLLFTSDPVLLFRSLLKLVRELAAVRPDEHLRLFVRIKAHQINFLLHYPVSLNSALRATVLRGSTQLAEISPRHNPSHLIEQLLEGRIEYLSREPMGTILIVSLPRHPAAATAA